jgi:hypothetical protein
MHFIADDRMTYLPEKHISSKNFKEIFFFRRADPDGIGIDYRAVFFDPCCPSHAVDWCFRVAEPFVELLLHFVRKLFIGFSKLPYENMTILDPDACEIATVFFTVLAFRITGENQCLHFDTSLYTSLMKVYRSGCSLTRVACLSW